MYRVRPIQWQKHKTKHNRNTSDNITNIWWLLARQHVYTHTGLATEYCSELHKHKHSWSTLFITLIWKIIFKTFLNSLKEAILIDVGRSFHSTGPFKFYTLFPKHRIDPIQCKLVLFLVLWLYSIHSLIFVKIIYKDCTTHYEAIVISWFCTHVNANQQHESIVGLGSRRD